jgi:TRAP-type C4-dicarboxylate transport system permease small subunit
MDPLEHVPGSAPPPRRGVLFHVGAAGLLAVMVIETLSVIGRHAGSPLLGALELIQAAILLAACAAMVSATATDAHATVHLVIDRLSPRVRTALLRVGAALSALFFSGLFASSLWLAVDFWHAHEQSELLGIPFRLLRAIVAASAGAIAALFLRRAVRSTRP